MHEKELSLRQQLKDDFEFYATRILKIRTKAGSVAPFVMNDAQKLIHARLEAQIRDKGLVRALILKGRQQGCSTYVQGRFYWKVTHRRGVRAFIMTHRDEATRNLYQITRRFHDHCSHLLRPSTSASNVQELVFDTLDSGYRVSTARAEGTGRSDTIQYFHGSEVAYWAHAEDHMSGVIQAVPGAPGTEVILESTSNGANGIFFDLCQAALKGESEYELIFIPWTMQGEYKISPPAGFIATPEEDELKTKFALDDAQVFWRRSKIRELGGIHKFRREYPLTVEEAFHTDVPGALFARTTIDCNRVLKHDVPLLKRIVVAVDPATTSNGNSDETGIIVAGLGENNHGYVLEDLSGVYAPAVWARLAVAAYHKHKADRIIAEVNQGGDMVEHTIRSIDPNVPFKGIHASRGKRVRAEPIAALDDDGRIHHAGFFPKLEDQMCAWSFESGESPDRLDARVWAMTELMLGSVSGGPKVWQL